MQFGPTTEYNVQSVVSPSMSNPIAPNRAQSCSIVLNRAQSRPIAPVYDDSAVPVVQYLHPLRNPFFSLNLTPMRLRQLAAAALATTITLILTLPMLAAIPDTGATLRRLRSRRQNSIPSSPSRRSKPAATKSPATVKSNDVHRQRRARCHRQTQARRSQFPKTPPGRSTISATNRPRRQSPLAHQRNQHQRGHPRRRHRPDQDLEEWMVGLDYREDVYRAVKAYADTKPKLKGEDAKLLSETMRDYRRAGLDLPKAERDEVETHAQGTFRALAPISIRTSRKPKSR